MHDLSLADTRRQAIATSNQEGYTEIIFFAEDDTRMNTICQQYTCAYTAKRSVSFMPIIMR